MINRAEKIGGEGRRAHTARHTSKMSTLFDPSCATSTAVGGAMATVVKDLEIPRGGGGGGGGSQRATRNAQAKGTAPDGNLSAGWHGGIDRIRLLAPEALGGRRRSRM